MLDVHLRLFCERLKRVLAGEEGSLTLPDSTNLTPLFQKLFTETEVITTLLGNYEGDLACRLIQFIKELDEDDEDAMLIWQLLGLEANVKRPEILEILEDINYLVHESEEAIDTFFINSMQQQSSESESITCKALLVGLHSKIIDIRNRMQQLPPGDNEFDISERRDKLNHLLIERQPGLDESAFVRGREEFFDLLIEGHPQLSVVAILDSSGFDKTAFAADTFNNNHVRFYFDCLAWVRVSIIYDFGKILDEIIKSVMPPSRVSVINGSDDYELKKTILRDYLKNKKYFIVLDDVFHKSEIWDDLEEVLPDNQNGSRVLITVTDPSLLTPFELENGEEIGPDSVFVGGPLIRIKYETWQFFILHYGSTPLKNYIKEKVILTMVSGIYSLLELPFYMKLCCIYLCVFRPNIEISARQFCQLWLAEGLIPHNSEKTAEHFLKELIDRGFIQVSMRSAGGTIKACYVTSLVYSVIFLVSTKTGFIQSPNEEVKSLANAKRYFIVQDLIEFFPLQHSDMYLHSFLNHSSESDLLDPIDCESFCKIYSI